MDLVAEVIAVAAKLGLSSWERFVFIFAAALIYVLGRRGVGKLVEAARNAEAEPQIVADENGPQPPGQPGPTADEQAPDPLGGMG